MRISDWSSDVCSSDLEGRIAVGLPDRISSLGQSGVRREPGPPRADQEEPASASIIYRTVCNGTRLTLHGGQLSPVPAGPIRVSLRGTWVRCLRSGARPARS